MIRSSFFFWNDREDGGRLPSHVDLQVGDKLKVYYGPMQDSKVTYEAKVTFSIPWNFSEITRQSLLKY